MSKKPGVYSLKDTRVVFSHPAFGMRILTDEGNGTLTISHTGDMSSLTETGNGYAVINRLESHSGTATINCTQNSEADKFLTSFASYLKTCSNDEFAEASINVYDAAISKNINCAYCTLQKTPDRNYDTAAGTIAYAFLCGDIQD